MKNIIKENNFNIKNWINKKTKIKPYNNWVAKIIFLFKSMNKYIKILIEMFNKNNWKIENLIS